MRLAGPDQPWGCFICTFAKKILEAVSGIILPLLPVGCISWMIYRSTEGIASPYYAGILMTILAVGLVWSWTFLENLTTGVLSIGTYYLACRLHGPADIAHGIGYNNFYFPRAGGCVGHPHGLFQ